MVNIIILIISLILTGLLIYYCVRMYKKSNGLVERVLYIVFLIVYFIPILVYYLDKYDIPTKIGYFNSMDTNRWFDFVSSYLISIVASIISGAILVLLTIRQIKIQIDNNNDDKRIQNAPIFDYELCNDKNVICKYNHGVDIGEQGNQQHIFFKIENIGLNHSRNINILIKVDGKKDRKFSLNGYQSFIRKNEFVWIDLIFSLEREKKSKRRVTIEVYYDDMINNKYVQRINAIFDIENDKNEIIVITDFNVNNEELIKE